MKSQYYIVASCTANHTCIDVTEASEWREKTISRHRQNEPFTAVPLAALLRMALNRLPGNGLHSWELNLIHFTGKSIEEPIVLPASELFVSHIQLLFRFVLDYAIRKVHKNQVGLK
jgi:hypothetical protein